MSLRVVHLAYYYGSNTMGAPVAATRLHKALLRAGIDSHFICVVAKETGENVHCVPGCWLFERLFYIVTRGLWLLSRVFFGRVIMANIVPLWGFSKTIRMLAPDVIHIHLIAQDMLSFRQIESFPCAYVYTLHDLTPIIATDTHPWSDMRFIEGYDSRNSTLIERWMFSRKKDFVQRVNPVFTAPSKWSLRLFEKSLIGHGRKVWLIPNVNAAVFSYDPLLRRPHKDFVMIFGAFGGRSSKFKGWKDFLSAVSKLPADVREHSIVHVFGESQSDCVECGLRVHFLGFIDSSDALKAAYHRADVYVLPSRQDNAPQVKFEALACGLPVLSFNRSGCAEYINSGENGWVAPDGNVESYAHGIEFFYREFVLGKLEQRRPLISNAYKDKFSEEEIVRRYVDVYKKSLVGDG